MQRKQRNSGRQVGFAGWLAPVAAMQTILPAALLVQAAVTAAHARPMGALPHGTLAAYVVAFGNAALGTLAAYVALLMWHRARRFRRVAAWSLWSTVVFWAAQPGIVAGLTGSSFGHAYPNLDLVAYAALAIVVVFWVEYVWTSKRVRNTFTREFGPVYLPPMAAAGA